MLDLRLNAQLIRHHDEAAWQQISFAQLWDGQGIRWFIVVYANYVIIGLLHYNMNQTYNMAYPRYLKLNADEH